MKYLHLCGTLLAAALTLVVARTAEAGFETAVPADVIMFVGIDDIDELGTSFDQTAWGQLFLDPQFDGMKEALQSAFDEMAIEAEQEVGSNPFDLLEMVSGPAAFVLLDADIQEESMDAGDVPVALALMLGVGENGEEFLDRFDSLVDQALEGGKMVRQSEEAAGVEVFALFPAEEGDKDIVVRYGVAGDTFLLLSMYGVFSDRDYFTGIVEGLAGEGEDTLVDADAFARSLAGDQSDGIRVFVDTNTFINRALDVAGSELDQEELSIIESLGVRDIGSFSSIVTCGDDGMRFGMELLWPGDGAIMNVMTELLGRGQTKLARLVPEEPISFSAVHIDLTAGIDAFMDEMRELAPEEADMATLQMEQVFQQDGFHVRTDILDNLTGEIAFFTAAVEDEMENVMGTEDDPVSFAVLIALQNGAGVETAIDTMVRSQGMHAARKREEFQGRTLYVLPNPMGGSLVYAVLDDVFLFSMSTELAYDVLRRHGEGGPPSLADNEDFLAALEQLGQGDVTSCGFSDSARSTHDIMDMLKSILETGEIPGTPVIIPPEDRPDLDFAMPDPELAYKYFKGPSVSTLTISEDGILMKASSP